MSKRKKDPHAERESLKYDNPIASREFILEFLESAGAPQKLDAIASHFNLTDEMGRTALHRRLRAMERDGQILFNRRKQYCIASKMDLVPGRVIAHPSGFGFLVPDKGGDDLFLSAREMNAVMHSDRVVAREVGIDRRGRREGVVVEILERGMQHVVGRLFIEQGMGFVIADNKRIPKDIVIAKDDFNGAKHGQIVSLEIIEYPTRNRQAIGKVIEVIGDHMAPGMEIDIAIRNHDLPQQWPAEVEAEIKRLTEQVSEADKSAREDIRNLPLVTIDGEDARDFDDAVYCEPNGKDWRLLVAIADVSHYVKPGSALDNEANNRGTSVYFPERVIPMLPEILSNGLCSLKPKVDRLCMVCDMNIGPNGQLKDYRFYPAVMHSHARLTYTKVAAMLVDGDKALCDEYKTIQPDLKNLYGLFKVLLKARERRGAIEFESTETRIVFGEDKKIEQIVPVTRNDAHRLIEECMLMANVATAEYLDKYEMPALYRNHEPPGEEKLSELREFLSEIGLNLGGGNEPEPAHYKKLLESIRDRHDSHLIQTVLLRSLKQAVYAPDNLGHFGLAYEAYAHFTSPIRRYPDLLVHRAIRHILSGKSVERYLYSADQMAMLGDHCSVTERRADEATRDATDWLKCEYMLDKLGEQYPGVITTVTGFGIFVELKDIYVEGLIHITALKQDYYHHDPIHHRLIGERTGNMYRLGDPINVLVARVDLDEKKIDFDLADSQPNVKQNKNAGKTKSGSTSRNRKSDKKNRNRTKGQGKKSGQKKSGKKKLNNNSSTKNISKKKTTKKKVVAKKTSKKKQTNKKTAKKKSVRKKTAAKKTSSKKKTGTSSKKKPTKKQVRRRA
ncbi:3'-to-5' exoribonuclease RNase R [hydrothermal vent metagenome]|uniref:exoribonuclease II n=1 Tax=hydrothermal vent metagenome TaxID=652676 RepID=A0A3B1AY62_9ZZZZ